MSGCDPGGQFMSWHTPQSQGAHDTHDGGLCDVVTSRDTLRVSVTLPGHSSADTHHNYTETSQAVGLTVNVDLSQK